MTTQIKSLMFAAAVAILPVACGTSGSPTGMDVAAIEASAGLSALRLDPTTPQAPVPQSPESEPMPAPGDPGQIPTPDPKETEPTQDEPSSVPVPSHRPNRPAPQDPGPDTVPDSDGPDTVPTEVPPTSDPSENEPTAVPPPVPPTGDPIPTPLPVPTPPSVPTPAKCDAASIEINVVLSIVDPGGDGFVAVLKDKAGVTIEDMSCEKLVWNFEGAGSAATITYGETSRHVTIDGAIGSYKIGASAPNGVSASIVFGGGDNGSDSK